MRLKTRGQVVRTMCLNCNLAFMAEGCQCRSYLSWVSIKENFLRTGKYPLSSELSDNFKSQETFLSETNFPEWKSICDVMDTAICKPPLSVLFFSMFVYVSKVRV